MVKRKQGGGQKKGETKGEILRHILKHPTGLKEDDLRVYLKENFNVSHPRGIKKHLSEIDRFIYNKHDSGKTNLWYMVYEFGILFDLIEQYPDLKKDVLKWLIAINKEDTGEYRKLILAKKIISFDELTKLATLIEKLDGGFPTLLLLGTDPFKDIILSLITALDLNIIKPISNMRLSQPYIGELFVLLVNSPTPFIDFIRFMVDYNTKKIDLDIITEVRDIMDIHPIKISELADGHPLIDIDLRWFECENDSTIKPYPALTLISELNDILYRAFMKDLKEEKTLPLTIKILRDTQNNLIELEKEKKKKRKMGKRGFREYLKQLISPA